MTKLRHTARAQLFGAGLLVFGTALGYDTWAKRHPCGLSVPPVIANVTWWVARSSDVLIVSDKAQGTARICNAADACVTVEQLRREWSSR